MPEGFGVARDAGAVAWLRRGLVPRAGVLSSLFSGDLDRFRAASASASASAFAFSFSFAFAFASASASAFAIAASSAAALASAKVISLAVLAGISAFCSSTADTPSPIAPACKGGPR